MIDQDITNYCKICKNINLDNTEYHKECYDDLKNNIYHSIDSFCRDTDQEINNADDNDKLNAAGVNTNVKSDEYRFRANYKF